MEILHANQFRYIDSISTDFSARENWIFLMSGSDFQAFCEGRSYPFSCNNFFILHPGQTLHLEYTGGGSKMDVVVFCMEETERQKLSRLPLPEAPSMPPNAPEIKNMMRNICDLFYSADKYRNEKMGLLVTNLFYAIASGDEVCEPGEELYYAMREVRRKMSDNPLLYTSVTQPCAALRVSPSHFQHLYRSYFHTTFIKDLNRARIKRAEAMLLSTTMTVSDIAHTVGFENENYFYRQFKLINGITPAKFRKCSVW